MRSALVGIALVLSTMPGPGGAANMLWEPPVRVGPGPEEGSHRFQDLLPGPGPELRLHAFVNRRVSRFSVRAFDLVVGADLDWKTSWAARREFTYDNGTPQSAYEVHAAVDSRDGIHVVHEAFDLFPPAQTLHIGYKSDAGGDWRPDRRPVLRSVTDIENCTGANPGICVARDADGREWVHVLYHRRPLLPGPDASCRSFVYVHDARPADDPSPAGGWIGESWFADAFVGQGFTLAGEGGVGLMPVADGRGRLHVIGRRHDTGSDSLRICHVFGSRAGTGRPWSTTVIELDSMPRRTGGEDGPYERPLAAPVVLVRGEDDEGEVLDAVWNHNVVDGKRLRKEVRFARFAAGPERWSAPIGITPEDSSSSHTARLHRAADGVLHVVYHEREPGTGVNRLVYRRAAGDPRVASSWSAPQCVTGDLAAGAIGPVFAAEADTVWLGFTSDDPSVGPETRWQAWFRRGVPIGAATAGDAAWSGLVCLDRDFVVREGDTLRIAPGTRIVAAESSAADVPGFAAGEVDLVVRGAVVAEGTGTEWIGLAPPAGASRVP